LLESELSCKQYFPLKNRKGLKYESNTIVTKRNIGTFDRKVIFDSITFYQCTLDTNTMINCERCQFLECKFENVTNYKLTTRMCTFSKCTFSNSQSILLGSHLLEQNDISLY